MVLIIVIFYYNIFIILSYLLVLNIIYDIDNNILNNCTVVFYLAQVYKVIRIVYTKIDQCNLIL